MTFYEVFNEAISKCKPACGYSDAKYELARNIQNAIINLDESFKQNIYVNTPYGKGEKMSIVYYNDNARTFISYIDVKFKKAGEQHSKYSAYFSGPSTLYIPVAAITPDESLMSQDVVEYINSKVTANPETLRIAEVKKQVAEAVIATEELRNQLAPLIKQAGEFLAPYKEKYDKLSNECYDRNNSRTYEDPEYKSASEIYNGIVRIFADAGIRVSYY